MAEIAAVHDRLDAIGNEHEADDEDSPLGTGATAVAECLGIDPHELKAMALERVQPGIQAALGDRYATAGVIVSAYIDAFLAGAAWGREQRG